MLKPIPGIHHVTALATDPQLSYDFYAKLLGLRLVKRTVNFDDSKTYHLYFGDDLGRPGTVITLFPSPNYKRGSRGGGQATVTSLSVPQGSLGFWTQRFESQGVFIEGSGERFDEEYLSVLDFDGLEIELVAHAGAEDHPPRDRGDIPAEYAIRGLYSSTLSERGYESTAEILTGVLGFRDLGSERNRFRFDVGPGGAGARLDVLCVPGAPYGRNAAGTVHHVAFRVTDHTSLVAWRERLAGRGLDVTPILDRHYFESIYFREPGGVLFELATDTPGFTRDESAQRLGTELMLPPWLEAQRGRLEETLPALAAGET